MYCSTDCHRSRGSSIPLKNCSRVGCENTYADDRRTSPRKYCSRTCSTTVNNSMYPKRKVEGSCEVCSSPIASFRVRCDEHTRGSSSGTSVCGYEGCLNTKGSWSLTCKDCYPKRRKDAILDQWLRGEYTGGVHGLAPSIRDYILLKVDFRCDVCAEQNFHPRDGKTVNQIDHINGNGFDHREENLRVLCPTHHALTDTYGNRNAGNGRDSMLARMRVEGITEEVGIEVVGVVH